MPCGKSLRRAIRRGSGIGPGDIMDPNVVKTVLGFETCAVFFAGGRFRGCGIRRKDSCAHLKHLGL